MILLTKIYSMGLKEVTLTFRGKRIDNKIDNTPVEKLILINTDYIYSTIACMGAIHLTLSSLKFRAETEK